MNNICPKCEIELTEEMTKGYVYILVNKKISPFVKELITYYKDYIEVLKK